MNLSEGESSDEVALSAGNDSIHLPFQIRCDKFDVSFYDTGAPKEFRSDLVIIENGKEVQKESIVVNDPLTYNGVTFYQASYGAILKKAELELKDRDSGKTITMTVPYREVMTIPGTKDQLQISEYQENLMRVGPALGVVIGKEGQENVSGSWVLVNRPDFHGNKIQNYQIRVLNSEQGHYTGLQVKKDPGIWLVWIGFSVMVLGIGLTFYSSHQKLWVCAEPDKKGKGIIVTIAGRTSRNAPGFGEKFDEICKQIEAQLNPEKSKKA
jgi:cytochrome c biogenesis protein